jgi:GDP/UDP-N,N'-diacetylbacillosamine 2-epimerase (hydrolysing)
LTLATIRNIAVFTSIRSDYGPLLSVLQEAKMDPDIELKILVGGAHLSEEFGMSVNDILADGFIIDHRFPFLPANVSRNLETMAMSNLLKQMGQYLSVNRPDMLVVLGDRYELLSVAAACLVQNIPLGHIGGGEITEGAIDNQVRNAITKMANLHFTSTEEYKDNVISMGEEKWRVFNCGEPALDIIRKIQFIDKSILFEDLNLSPDKPIMLCTFHPETIDNAITPGFVKELIIQLSGLNSFSLLVTAANFDKGGHEINRVLEQFDEEGVVKFVKNLGQKRYYSILKTASLVLGNSSSGLIEVQSFNIPVVNVGKRQLGRLANPNVFHVEADPEKIVVAARFVLTDTFQEKFRDLPNRFGDGYAGKKILNVLKNLSPDCNLVFKRSVY